MPTLLALLKAENEPTPNSYKEIVEDIIQKPDQISDLTEDNVRDDLLILLSTQSHRLAQFFRRLYSDVRQTPKSSTTSNIAAKTTDLLVGIVPSLHQLLDPNQVLDFLVPALDVCFASSQRPTLRELASMLVNSGTLLERLVSDHLGIAIIRQWASMQSAIALDAEILELWTERLVSMVHNCDIDHDVTHEIQRWHTLKTLKSSLQNIKHNTSRLSSKTSTPITRHDLPGFGSMRQLNRDDKKARLARHQDNSDIPSLQDEDKRSLQVFQIHVPGSKSSLQDVIKRLKGEETTKILLSIVSKLPCYLCISGLGSLTQFPKGGTHDESFRAVPTSQIEIFNKGLGVWRVLLSPQALRSVLHMGSHGKICP